MPRLPLVLRAPWRRTLACGVVLLAATLGPRTLQAQTVIGEMRAYLDGGAYGFFDSTTLDFRAFIPFGHPAFDDPLASVVFADHRVFSAADAGFTFTLDQSSPGFTELAAVLTNDEDNTLYWEHAGGGFGSSETYFEWSYTLPSSGPAFAGYSISSLQFTINSLYFNSPDPEDPWTNYVYDLRMVAYSASPIPEPSTYATIFGVVILAGATLMRRRRRSA